MDSSDRDALPAWNGDPAAARALQARLARRVVLADARPLPPRWIAGFDVGFEDAGATYICHKWNGFEADPAAKADPAVGTHLWSHRAFARPEAEITGLSFLFGGYHRLGNCVARGQGGYTVYGKAIPAERSR